ncbi:EAL and HDOD domain-containing protein [Jeotgalibaca porci]|uniref:EAL and HDOD domain-containing protein n=1 Tax=Jeotgalibaca porci TaxID=1868793 RepID=UPI0035A11CD5
MDVYIARQPIFDRKLAVFGYELLYRRSMNNFYEGWDDTQATAELINNAFLTMHFSELTEGTRAFINFSDDMLIDEIPRLLPSETVFVEILETVEVTDELLEAIKRLRKSGYTIVLDDFVFSQRHLPLVDVADMIKIEFNKMNTAVQKLILKKYRHKIKFIAEKVETREEFQDAMDMGYDYFQGYFFSKPMMIKSKEVSYLNINLIRILELLHHTEPDFEEIREVIATDLGLSYKLLRLANSVLIGKRHKITSVKRAMVQLGLLEMRKWIYIIMLKDFQMIENKELIKNCLIRAKMMELVAVTEGKDEEKEDYFLAGMFSEIDVLMNRKMADLVAELPLKESVRTTLLGGDNQMKQTLDHLIEREKNENSEQEKQDAELMVIYLEALAWVSDIQMI